MKRVLLFTVILFTAAFSFGQQKYALVIGNGAYTHVTKLNNPVNDANDVAAALQGLGFTVDKLLNASQEQMESAAIRLKNRLSASKNSYGLLFYAGHGVQSGGENYLIPVDANIQSESFLRSRAVSVQAMLDELNEAGNELNVVVLDACRDNPFSWKRSGTRGLTIVGQQPADSIIVFATSAGSTAADGTGRNGLFTSYFLKNLKTPGLEVNEIFRLTMGDVARASDNQQRPAVYNQFAGLAWLGSRPVASAPVQPAPAPATPKPAPTPAPTPAPKPTPAPTPAPVQAAAPPQNPVSGNMVRINGGTFQMGSNNGDSDEKPVHTVTVSSFYMGKYEVTQKEWTAVMGSNPSSFTGDNLPVENVSWYSAVEYCNKRSQREGLTPAYTVSGTNVTWNKNANGYRLPTEAEWEYAAKGGNGSPGNYTYAGSNNADEVAWYSGSKTQNVGTKKPNGLGLYDMSGNVWEWCWDWYGSYSSAAQTDPAGASSGSTRVLRGGSWGRTAEYVRSASRGDYYPSDWILNIGFRVVRPIN